MTQVSEKGQTQYNMNIITYEWEILNKITFPLFVNTMVLNGRQDYPNITVSSITELKNLMIDVSGGFHFNVNSTRIFYNGFVDMAGTINNVTPIHFILTPKTTTK